MRLIVVLILLVFSTAAMAERRVALVMSADDYRLVRPLANAGHDASAMERALKALGFEVFTESNRDLRRMRRALDDFREDARGADVALFFFSGHGVEIGGDNRLLPVDADASSADILERTSLPLEDVRDAVASVARVGLVVLDACRNDPFSRASSGGGRGAVALTASSGAVVKPGLGRVGRAENILFAFSAAPGETASDGDSENSPFTQALSKYLGTDGLEIRSVLTLVQQEVYDRTGGRQLPYVESGLPRTFFAATGNEPLPERERLLLAMADVTPELRAEVEQIAARKDMPLAPLYGALISSGGASLTAVERSARLNEAATAFVKVRDELRTMSAADPQVGALREAAEGELALGAFDAARARLDEAARLDSTSRQALKTNLAERTLSEASTRYIAGGAARAELRYDLAISDLEKAVALFGEAGEAALAPEPADRRLSALAQLGDIYVTLGNLASAGRAYETLQLFMRKRLEGDSADPSISRDMAVTLTKLGNVRVAQGNLAEALRNFRAARDILQAVVASAPGHAGWQGDLAVANDEIGDVLMAQGELEAAIETYRVSLAIKQKLVAAAPDDPGALRDLTVTYDALADVFTAAGAFEDARTLYGESLRIRRHLVEREPDSIGRQRDLAISYDKMGDVLREGDDPEGALASYRAGADIARALARRDPNDTELRRDISVSNSKIGNVLRDGNDLDGAYAAYAESLAETEELAAADPSNADWQRDRSVSLEKVAEVLRRRGDLKGALANYRASLVIVRTLAAADPTNAEWQRDLSITLGEIGVLCIGLRDARGAGEALEESLAIREKLAASAPGNARWQRDLAIALTDFAEVAPNPRAHLERAKGIASRLAAEGRMADADQMIAFIDNRLERLKAKGR